MKVNAFALQIDNFDNQAMVSDRTGEVCRILRELADRIEENGVPNADGVRLMDSNGQSVGEVSVGIDFDKDQEDD